FLVLQPVIGKRNWHIRDPKRAALDLEHLPQLTIIGMKAQHRTRSLLHLARSQKVIKVCVCVENAHDGQAEITDFFEYPLVIAPWVYDNCLLGDRIPQDRTVTPERRHRKRSSDKACHAHPPL